jgi:CDP-glycerol glycerophosphotransferase (TagB/SpsB family)
MTETHAATMDELLDALEACVAPHGPVVDLEEYRWLRVARLAVKAWDEAQLIHATAQLAMAVQKDGAVQSERVRHLIAEVQRFGERTGRAQRRTG